MGDGMTHIRRGIYFPSRQPTPLEFATELANDEIDGAPANVIELAKAHVATIDALRELIEALDERDRTQPWGEPRDRNEQRMWDARDAARRVLG